MADTSDPSLGTPSDRPAAEDATEMTIQRLLADQRERFQRGDRNRVEDYLRQEPALLSRPETILDLIYNEVLLREAQGEKPELHEYVNRFPQLAGQLEIQFEIDRAIQSKTIKHPTQRVSAGTAPPAPPASVIKSVAGYELLEVLGFGGMGVVYKARQRSLNRIVALKMMRSGAQASPGELARFRIEAEAVARLQHPHIVQIFEVGEADDQAFLALEFVDGSSLSKKLDGSAWPARQAARFLEILARAIHYAHEQGIVHRDLKPANILLQESGIGNQGSGIRRQESGIQTEPASQKTASGTKKRASGIMFPEAGPLIPKITDFGLAKMMTGEQSGLTHTGDFLGTPSYTAPEQAAGRIHDIGPHTDVYSLGAILYELLTGRPPFRAPTVLETLDMVRKLEPVSPLRLQRNLPRDLETICLKCLQKDPRRRYASALFLAEDLQRFLKGEPIQARPIGRTEQFLKWVRRRPLLASLIGVSSAAAILFLLGLWRHTVELGAAAERESNQRRQAEANFAQALDAVERMLTEVGAVELADLPHLEPVRKKLLHQAKDFYDKFLKERGSDPAVRYLAGRAFSRLGDIQDMLDEQSAAEQSYVQARSLLSEEASAGAGSRRELARACNNLGVVLKKLGHFAEAEKALRQALALRQQLQEEFAPNRDFQQDLAASQHDLGTVLARIPKGRRQAQEAYEGALRLQKELAEDYSDNQDYQRDYARTLNNLGILLRGTQPSQAEQKFLLAVVIHEKVVRKRADVPGYKRELARSYNNLAGLFRISGQRSKALETYDKALRIIKQLTVDFPTVPAYRQDLAGIYHNLGLVHEKGKQLHEAELDYRQALEIRQRLAGEFPKIADYKHALANVHITLGRFLEEKKRQPWEAEKHYRQAVELLGKIAGPDGRPVYQSDLGQALNHQALFLLRRSKLADAVLGLDLVLQAPAGAPRNLVGVWLRDRAGLLEARACLLRAIDCQRAARAADRLDAAFAQWLHEHYNDLVTVQLRLADHEGVAAAARAFPRIFPDRAREYVLAAECLARAIPLAAADARLSSQQQKEVINQYAREAVRFLEEAVDRGFAVVQQLKTKAFDPLRRRSDFRRLIEKMEKSKMRIS